MFYRFKINQVNGNGTSDSTVAINYLDLAVSLKLNGISVIEEADVSSFTGSNIPISIISGITVLSTELINDIIQLEINFETISKFCNLTLEVSKDGYNIFQTSFRLYGYDIGNDATQNNNQGQAITDNPNMDITLCSTDDVNPYNFFTVLQIPFTNSLQIVKLDSSNGNVKYYDASTNQLILSYRKGIVTCSEKVYRIKSVNTYEDNISTVYFNGTLFALRPKFNIVSECLDCIENCVSIDNTPKATIYFTEDSTYFFVNDKLVNGYENIQLQWNLYDTGGDTIISTNYEIPKIDSIPMFNPLEYGFDYKLEIKGDYIIEAALIFNKQFECFRTLVVKGCDLYEVKKDAKCSNISIINRSYSDTVYNVYMYDAIEETYNLLLENLPIKKLDTTVHSFTSDAIYKIIVDPENEAVEFIVPIYCSLIECYNTYLNKLLFAPCNTLPSEQDVYKFNMFSMLYNSYFAILQKYSLFEQSLSNLPADVTPDILILSEIQSSLYKYCETCNSPKINDCGCN